MQSLKFDAVIIGGGAVGLACAQKLSQERLSQVLLLEQHDRLGTETTARNSEVIHAGIYYEPGSLKERLCIDGKYRLYEFCERFEIAHRRCGKLVVGTASADHSVLEKILANAKRNHVPVEIFDRPKLKGFEPRIAAEIAVYSPTTGIICSESYTQRLAQLAEEQGVVIARSSKVTGWERTANGNFLLNIQEPASQTISVETPIVVNSAGHGALKLAQPIFGQNPPFTIKCVRGHYFTLSPKYTNVCANLIYPIPDTKGGGLGIHLTLNLEGIASLGPDTDWRFADAVNYAFHDEDLPTLKEKFCQAATQYLPGIQPSDLQPSFVGVRPKRVDKEGKMLDFYIQEESRRGYAGWVNLIGVESPGLTASLAIASEVEKILMT
ncbi:MAG: NAD(P)/FAD-dependent oxidoreductase [Bdellovibrionota bacterium]